MHETERGRSEAGRLMLPSIGTDLVCVPAFADQLSTPGSTFEQVFTVLEQRIAMSKPSRVKHLAGRWAAKEAFIKAWSQALYGQPPVIEREETVWQEIEVRPDQWGRVAIVLSGRVREEFEKSIPDARVSLSISHDGDFAMAQCLIA